MAAPPDFPAPMMAAISRMGTPFGRICDGRGNVTRCVTSSPQVKNLRSVTLAHSLTAPNQLPSPVMMPAWGWRALGSQHVCQSQCDQKEPVARATTGCNRLSGRTDKRGVKMKGEQVAKNANLLRAELRRQGINPGTVKPKPKPLFGQPAARLRRRILPFSAVRWRR